MVEIVLELVSQVIKVIFLFKIFGLLNTKREEKNFNICYIGIFLVLHFSLNMESFKFYIFQNVSTFMFFVLVGYIKRIEVDILIPNISLLLFCYEILVIASSILGTVITVFLPDILFVNEIEIMIVNAIIFRLLGVYCVSKIIKHNLNEYKRLINRKYAFTFIYCFIVCIKIPFLYTEIRDALALKMVILTILCCTVIFLIISGIDKHNAEKERIRIEENNKKLTTRLHKSQEILPAMVQVLSQVTENGGTEMETQKAQELLKEVSGLYGRQLRENSEEDLQLKNFCSTGLKILDQQLRVYQREAIDRNVNLDIFVQAPINGIIEKDDIDQLKLQRAVGDLVRNAFRAVESEDKKCRANKHILLIIGCRYEDILEVAVVDNGTEFPLHVIEAFGKRGVTTGGTGNGLADLVEFADDMGASISVDEFDGRTSLFTKRVSISFDKQRKHNFNSSRKEYIGGSFWNTWK